MKLHTSFYCKIYLLSICFLLFYRFDCQSQTTSQKIPLSIAYYGHYLIQPGFKIGTQITLKTWEKEIHRKKGSVTKQRSLFISPQLGLFTRIRQNTNYLFNTELGYKTQKKGRKTYVAFSTGLGYLLQNKVTSFSVNLGNGDLGNKQRELVHIFLPTLNFEFGGAISARLGWYTKYTVGYQLSFQQESKLSMFLEAGAKIFLFTAKKS